MFNLKSLDFIFARVLNFTPFSDLSALPEHGRFASFNSMFFIDN